MFRMPRSWVIGLVGLLVACGVIFALRGIIPPDHGETKRLPTAAPLTLDGRVVGLPVLPGDPVVVQVDNPESRWKEMSIVTKNQNGRLGADMGLGYEVIKLNPELGPVKLPEVSGDVLVTPSRYGVGVGLELNQYTDVVGGLQRSYDGESGYYAGVGFHLRF